MRIESIPMKGISVKEIDILIREVVKNENVTQLQIVKVKVKVFNNINTCIVLFVDIHIVRYN